MIRSRPLLADESAYKRFFLFIHNSKIVILLLVGLTGLKESTLYNILVELRPSRQLYDPII